ncbi:hypothetical protein MBANPS3_006973 [Mucor bainieri]
MSSLQKDMFKKSTLPPLGSFNENENYTTEERLPMNATTAPSAARQPKASHFSPANWQDYFETSLDILIPNTSDISFS